MSLSVSEVLQFIKINEQIASKSKNFFIISSFFISFRIFDITVKNNVIFKKKIMKNKEISARIMESKDEFLYKKIFEFVYFYSCFLYI